MSRLYVLPANVVSVLQEAGHSLTCLNDVNKMVEVLSAHDMAEIHLAMKRFPFEFDKELEITFGELPLNRLSQEEVHEHLFNRVETRVTTQMLRDETSGGVGLPEYTLYCVDETLWVAVQQRLYNAERDPSRLLLSLNRGFFDALIAQKLFTQSIEEISSTNLFTYFLESLPAEIVA